MRWTWRPCKSQTTLKPCHFRPFAQRLILSPQGFSFRSGQHPGCLRTWSSSPPTLSCIPCPWGLDSSASMGLSPQWTLLGLLILRNPSNLWIGTVQLAHIGLFPVCAHAQWERVMSIVMCYSFNISSSFGFVLFCVHAILAVLRVPAVI